MAESVREWKEIEWLMYNLFICMIIIFIGGQPQYLIVILKWYWSRYHSFLNTDRIYILCLIDYFLDFDALITAIYCFVLKYRL